MAGFCLKRLAKYNMTSLSSGSDHTHSSTLVPYRFANVKMLSFGAALVLSFVSTGLAQSPQRILSSFAHLSRIPTIHESAIQARRILNLSSIATFSTIFPNTQHPTPLENRPDDLAGAPIGLIDYYASCDPTPHEPTILAISIATSFKNARAGSNVTLSLRYHPPIDHPPGDDIYTYSVANLPRFSLIGSIKPIPSPEIRRHDMDRCFFGRHPDAVTWRPGNAIHEAGGLDWW